MNHFRDTTLSSEVDAIEDEDYRQFVGSRRSLGGASQLPVIMNDEDTPAHDSNPTTGAGNSTPGPHSGSSQGERSSISPPRKRRLLTPSESGASSDGIYEPSDDGDDSDLEDDDYQSEDESDEQVSKSKQSSRPGSSKVGSKERSQRDPKAPQISKLALKKQDRARRGIQLDELGTRTGTVRQLNGRPLEFCHKGEWRKAVYHYRIRDKLLRMTDVLGKYEEEPEKGIDWTDRTSFKPEHKDLIFHDRDRRPDVLFQWENPGHAPNYEPGFMEDNGRIVLSYPENLPVKDWLELPATLSGQIEGLRMEFYRRLNPSITMKDLKARMPNLTSKGKKLAQTSVKNPALANRCTRDRCKIGAKAWNTREGSLIKEQRILQMIPYHIQQIIHRDNSTRCWRDLTDAEVAWVDLGNKGTEVSLKKAGPRMLDPEMSRKSLSQKRSRRLNCIEKAGDDLEIHPVFEEALSKPGNAPRKRKSLSHASVVDDEEDRPKKRRYAPSGTVNQTSEHVGRHSDFSMDGLVELAG